MENQSYSPSMVASTPAPTVQLTAPKKHDTSILETVILIIVSLIAATFIGLFVWMYIKWDEVKTDVDGQIATATALAVNENTAKLEAEFVEKEKYPYTTFSGPEDYGELTFEYPRTWSAYIKSDAAKGGNFEAYFNPKEVPPISANVITSLHVLISAQTFDNYTTGLQNYVNSGQLKMSIIKVNGENANYYEGTLQNGLKGAMVVIKIRDKTAVLFTYSMLFKDDFDQVVKTIKYNS